MIATIGEILDYISPSRAIAYVADIRKRRFQHQGVCINIIQRM